MDSEKVLDLRLIRTLKTEPVVRFGEAIAREAEDGSLIWEAEACHVWTGEGGDSRKYDRQIAMEHLRRAIGWCPDPKIAKKLEKQLKRLSNG